MLGVKSIALSQAYGKGGSGAIKWGLRRGALGRGVVPT